ncbi:MAG: alpha/beta fold hydrolase [Hyphomicrobiales bacterium]|nr:alpha/beta fold hydrolase [Hyphomicrobiales bacterium]
MAQIRQQVRFCKSRDGTRIAYATCGDGPPVVFVQHWAHHLEYDWESPIWRPWLSLLTRHATLIRYDWRGCGLSDRESVELSFERYVDDLVAVVDAAAVEHAPVLAMAGAMCGAAATLAARRSELVDKLVLFASYTRGRSAASLPPEQAQETEARLKVMELGWRNDIPAYSQFFTALHIPDATGEQKHAYDTLLRLTTSPRTTLAMLRSFHRVDLRPILPAVRCPALVLHARQDAIMPFEEGRKVAALIPGARFVSLDSRNHILLDTEAAWERMVGAVEDFLAAPVIGASAAARSFADLTHREREVLELVARGLGNEAIARQLGISAKTVRNQVSSILGKVGAGNRAQAVIRAREAGFGRQASPSQASP